MKTNPSQQKQNKNSSNPNKNKQHFNCFITGNNFACIAIMNYSFHGK